MRQHDAICLGRFSSVRRNWVDRIVATASTVVRDSPQPARKLEPGLVVFSGHLDSPTKGLLVLAPGLTAI
jgi:hypothetical protein